MIATESTQYDVIVKIILPNSDTFLFTFHLSLKITTDMILKFAHSYSFNHRVYIQGPSILDKAICICDRYPLESIALGVLTPYILVRIRIVSSCLDFARQKYFIAISAVCAASARR
jgi:hypothetical protein